MASWTTNGVGLCMRRSLLFFAFCSFLDELVTFRILALGGVEFNPRVAWLLSVNPLLYPLADIIMIATAYAVDRLLAKRLANTWLIWTAAGLGRLLCVIISMVLMWF